MKNSEVIKKYKTEGNAACVSFVMAAYRECIDVAQDEMPTKAAFQWKINKVMDQHKAHVKATSRARTKSNPEVEEEMEKFLNHDFSFPVRGAARRSTQSSSGQASPQPSTSHGSPQPGTSQEPCRTQGSFAVSALESQKRVTQDIAGELVQQKKECDALKAENAALQASNMRLQKRKSSVEEFKGKVKQQKLELTNLQRQTVTLQGKCSGKTAELKRKSAQISFLQNKSQKVTREKNESLARKEQLENDLTALENTLEELKQERNDALEENDWLRDMVTDEIKMKKEDGSYTDETVQCAMDLLTHNVSSGQVPQVIQTVLKMAGKNASDIPSKSTVNNWNVMRLILSQKQLAEKMPDKPNLGLLSDETSKFGRKFEGFHASDAEGNTYVLGLRDIVSKSGQDVLSTFQQILRDIESISEDTDRQVSKEILLNISSTMSDRASTQLKFNSLLEDYRKEILPEMMDNYEHLSDQEREVAGKLCNFFCGLHALVHLADVASTSLLETQKGFFGDEAPIYDKTFSKYSEPGTTRMIRTTCKAVAQGGDEKSGCHGSFLEYMRPGLKQEGFSRLPIEPFRGNRFNILFANAAGTFYLADDLKVFLEDNCPNKLLKSVRYDLSIPEYMAGCKALGLVSYLVTMPLWSSIEDDKIHIIDIGIRYQEVIDFIVQAAANPAVFMTGAMHLSFADLRHIEHDGMYRKLVQDWTHDGLVETILKVMLPAMARLLQRIFTDHLEGGAWATPSDELREKLKGLPKHNKYSESVFGHLDRLLREKPSITTIASEAYIMFSRNKTSQWLSTKSPDEKSQLISSARSSVRKLRSDFKERQQLIQEARRAAVQEKLREAERIRLKRQQRREKQTNDIIYWGLWQQEEQLRASLAGITTIRDKVKALKAQLHFRQHVLKQKHAEPTVYAMTRRGPTGRRINLTHQELAENVKKLIIHSHSLDVELTADDAGQGPLLVGKRVRHRFIIQGEERWYEAKVVSQVPGYPSWYNVKYNEDESIYTYELMEDYGSGDLEIIV